MKSVRIGTVNRRIILYIGRKIRKLHCTYHFNHLTYPQIIVTYLVKLQFRVFNTNFMVKLNKGDFTIFKKLAKLVTFKNVLDLNFFVGNDVFKIFLKEGGGGFIQ